MPSCVREYNQREEYNSGADKMIAAGGLNIQNMLQRVK